MILGSVNHTLVHGLHQTCSIGWQKKKLHIGKINVGVIGDTIQAFKFTSQSFMKELVIHAFLLLFQITGKESTDYFLEATRSPCFPNDHRSFHSTGHTTTKKYVPLIGLLNVHISDTSKRCEKIIYSFHLSRSAQRTQLGGWEYWKTLWYVMVNLCRVKRHL